MKIKPEAIIKAWIQVAKQHTTEEHKRRARICEKCTHAKYKKFTDWVNDELAEIKGFVCNDCGCPLIAKIRSTETCRKWE